LKEHNRGEQLTCGFMATALYDSLFLLHASWYLCRGAVQPITLLDDFMVQVHFDIQKQTDHYLPFGSVILAVH
jgi:hypothetical protein